MPEKDISLYTIDDVMLALGTGLLVLLLALGCCGGTVEVWSLVAVFVVIGPVPMLLVGRHYRKKDKRANAMLRQLERQLEVPATTLCQLVGMDRKELEQALKMINVRALGAYEWNRETDMIYDQRLGNETFLVDECPSCGAPCGRSFKVFQQELPRCEYCSKPFAAEDFARLKHQARQQLDRQRIGQMQQQTLQKPSSTAVGPGFNVGVFVVLILVFWPLGLLYFYQHAKK